jgi:hypothetical protein
MSKDDKVKVKPVRTFQWGNQVKHAGDAPFEVAQHEAAELRANGLVAGDGAESDQKVAQEHDNKMDGDPDTGEQGGKPARKRSVKAD